MPNEIYASIGAVIRSRREKLGMTQGGLAEMAGLSRTSITNIERGGQALLVHQLLELARVLRVAPATFLPNTIEKEEPNLRKEVSGEFKALLDRLETTSVRKRSR